MLALSFSLCAIGLLSLATAFFMRWNDRDYWRYMQASQKKFIAIEKKYFEDAEKMYARCRAEHDTFWNEQVAPALRAAGYDVKKRTPGSTTTN